VVAATRAHLSPSPKVSNSTLGRVVRHLPNTLPHWRDVYADVCAGVGSSLDCAGGCSPIRRLASGAGTPEGATEELRKFQVRCKTYDGG